MVLCRLSKAAFFATACVLLMIASAWAASTIVEKPTPVVSASGTLIESIGIETLGGVFTPLLNSGSKVPCSIARNFSTAENGQTELKLKLFRGNAKLAKDTHRLGVYTIHGIPPQPRGEPKIVVTFTVKDNQITIDAFDKASNRSLEIEPSAF